MLKPGLPRALVLLAAIAAAMVWVRETSRRFLFPAHEVRGDGRPAGFREVSAIAADGVPARAFSLPADPHRVTIVYFHNNRETAASRAVLARALHARGLGVVLAEYRGYGVSRGAPPSEEGLYLDAEAVLGELAREGTTADEIVLWGGSLGTGVAAEMASRGRGAALVLEAPYTSIPDLVTDAAPVAPARALLADHFDTLAKASDIRVPTLVIHGDRDEVVPFWMGEHLATMLPAATLLRVDGGHHGDLFSREPERLIAAIAGLDDFRSDERSFTSRP